jgi:murein DD-endopeptidase MepM/ murein hydrolase activator NlpD
MPNKRRSLPPRLLFVASVVLAMSATLAAAFLTACEQPTPSSNLPATIITSTEQPLSPTSTSSATVSSPSPESPLVLDSPLDDTPEIFMNTYFGAIGASACTPENPEGIHQGIDLVAPAGTPVKAAAAGTVSNITTETKTEPDGTVNTYANVLVDFDDHNVLNYNFEPSESILVTVGQTVSSGEVLGTLGDNRGQNVRGTRGTGTLDLGLLSVVGGSFSRVCYLPCTSPAFRQLLETWFSRAYKATAEHPGPCVCHY